MWNAEPAAGRNQEGRGSFFILGTLVPALIASTLTACGYQFRVEGAGPTIGGAPTTSSQEPPPRLVVLRGIQMVRLVDVKAPVAFRSFNKGRFACGETGQRSSPLTPE